LRSLVQVLSPAYRKGKILLLQIGGCDSIERKGGAGHTWWLLKLTKLTCKVPSGDNEAKKLLRVKHPPHTLENIHPVVLLAFVNSLCTLLAKIPQMMVSSRKSI